MSVLKVRGIRHDAAASDAINLDSSGNVGIGTASPSTKLHVSGTTDELLRLDSTDVNPYLNFRVSGTRKAYMQFASATGVLIDSEAASTGINLATQGAIRMAIDSAGRVTKPYQPSFFVALTSPQTVSSGGQRINFNTILHNTGSHYSTSTYRFTAPVAGEYMFTACVSFDGISANAEIQIYKNGTAFAGRYNNTTGSTGQSMTVIFDLAASDYVEIYTYSGVGRTYTGRTDNWTTFCGQLLS